MSDITLNGSGVANKSWFDICEEEKVTTKNNDKNPTQDGLRTDNPNLHLDDEDTKMGFQQTPTKKDKLDDVNSFASYANILKKSSPELKNSLGNEKSEEVLKSPNNKKGTKRELQKDFLQDDLSLTSHLDVFQLQSPCKSIWKIDEIKSEKIHVSNQEFPKLGEWQKSAIDSPKSTQKDLENNRECLNGKRQVWICKTKDESVDVNNLTDDVLMPSPSKYIRGLGAKNAENSPKRKNFLSESRKRHRDSISSPRNGYYNNTSSPSFRLRESRLSNSTEKNRYSFSSPSNRPDLEIETDPAILARRQKQINYGKNTIGYEKYIDEIPRFNREKNHPKTPPKHIKFSRRAWDGLVKNWRRKLHYWDPISEGGGNPALLEGGDDLDMSSCDTSLYSNSAPSTPYQEYKRRRGSSSPEELEERGFKNEREEVYDYNEGCKPLTDNDD